MFCSAGVGAVVFEVSTLALRLLVDVESLSSGHVAEVPSSSLVPFQCQFTDSQTGAVQPNGFGLVLSGLVLSGRCIAIRTYDNGLANNGYIIAE